MWQQQLIDELRAIDREQAPHGLYGLRDAMSPGPQLITRSELFGGDIPSTNLAGRLGGTASNSRVRDDSISFRLPSREHVHLSIVDFASNKIRNKLVAMAQAITDRIGHTRTPGIASEMIISPRSGISRVTGARCLGGNDFHFHHAHGQRKLRVHGAD